MSGPVDVLAVLGEMESFMATSYPSYDSAEKLRAARAAVAELIGFVQDCADGRPEAEPSECRKRAIDLLAHIGGSK